MSTDPRLLHLIGDTAELMELEAFRLALLDALRRGVKCDWVALSDVGRDAVHEIVDPPLEPGLHRRFAELAYENPLVQHYAATRDGRALRISDVITQQEFHALEIYRAVYQPIGLEYQLAFTLPHTPGRILGVVLCRRDRDFSDPERDLVETARPFLIQAYRNAVQYSAALAGQGEGPSPIRLVQLGLTPRQAEVLALIATGAAERDAAARLGISHRTVQKHLELCYRTLGVDSRSRAAAIAWASVEPSGHAGASRAVSSPAAPGD